ncbi:MAG TPA: PH domain-containing protein [Candidatus Saccharimonadales bacterium]|nr:PH domain-containing protein [Candidatus Saccharimonadales bacterium]
MQPDSSLQPTPTPAPATPPPLSGVSRSMEADMLEPGEQVLTVVRRSFVGLLGIYLIATVAVATIVALVIAISPDTFSPSENNLSAALVATILLSALFLGLILFTATYVYRQSKLLITDRSLVQVLQKTLFNRKVSRLSMSDVEDVNEEQRGVFASIFNYGTLTVQTAGTEDNFIFSLCPEPARLADRVITARQAYTKRMHDEEASNQNT